MVPGSAPPPLPRAGAPNSREGMLLSPELHCPLWAEAGRMLRESLEGFGRWLDLQPVGHQSLHEFPFVY